jgi:hypothetical protein
MAWAIVVASEALRRTNNKSEELKDAYRDFLKKRWPQSFCKLLVDKKFIFSLKIIGLAALAGSFGKTELKHLYWSFLHELKSRQ